MSYSHVVVSWLLALTVPKSFFWSDHLRSLYWGRLDLAVLCTPSTQNRQNRNQVRQNTCTGIRRSTPSSKVVQTEQSRDIFQNKIAEHCLHRTEIFLSLSQ